MMKDAHNQDGWFDFMFQGDGTELARRRELPTGYEQELPGCEVGKSVDEFDAIAVKVTSDRWTRISVGCLVPEDGDAIQPRSFVFVQ